MAIYVIGPTGGSGPYKIGYSNDPTKRLSALQVGSPVPLDIKNTLPGNKDMEKLLHWIFQGKRIHGEWFQLGVLEIQMLIIITTDGIENCTDLIADYLKYVVENDPSANFDLLVELKLKELS